MKKQECNKIPYSTEEEAREHLRQIVEGNDYRIWKQTSPSRHYKCPLCSSKEQGVWHLTSTPTVIKYR